MVFTKNTLYVLTGGKKYAMLEAIQDGNATSEIKLELLKRNKADMNKENYELLINAIKNSNNGKRVGLLTKEAPEGELVQLFQNNIKASGIETIDVAKGIECALRTKESVELVSRCINAEVTHVRFY